jgi:uncharacterized NAD(P)/FAD-binding protein YdhS
MTPTPANSIVDRTFDVAIIGGGAAGVLVAIHLLRKAHPGLRVVLVEPRERLAEGVAYSTTHPEHLLNVIASRMSAFDHDPGDFVGFLERHTAQAEDAAAIATTFARRTDFARYLRSTLERYATNETLCWIRDEACGIERGGAYAVHLRGGGTLQSHRIVLASGNFPRAMPLVPSAGLGIDATRSAWHYDDVRGIDTAADVCIIGSSLSMVDAVMSLEAIGHHGRIDVISRHGLMPLPHATPGSQHGRLGDLLSLRLSERSRRLRSDAAHALLSGEPWQWTMDGVRPQTQALWRSLDAPAQRRFLRHAARFWDVHRHRIAPAAAATMDRLRRQGRLRVHAGKLIAMVREGDRCSVQFVPRRATQSTQLLVRYVINSTGVESSIKRIDSPLIASLLEGGMAMPGPHGIGIATNDAGALVAADGSSQPDLLTLGAPRIGQLWESIAIPELRGQAEAAALYLLERMAGHAASDAASRHASTV